MGDVYMPSRPVNPWDGDCKPCGPTPPAPGCGPCGPQPVPPPPHIPGCGPKPGACDIKPVPLCPPLIEGESTYEALNTVINRTNACIAQWNAISRNCFEAMNACVAAARSNDVYYDDCEVSYQEGYDENESCAYAVVEKKAVDRQGKPIFVSLVPAYNNTTNSGVKQGIFDVSFIKSANVIITAVPTEQDNWNGPAMYHGAAIPGNQDDTGYVYGFNRQGHLKYFAGTATTTDLCQSAMVDVIGGCIPIISNGSILESAQNLTKKAAITAIGFNVGTGSVFFFSCSNFDNPGMTGISVAKLLQGFGCTTAVITSAIEEASNVATTAGMLYMGQMSTVPADGREPENLAYWVISKRPNFNNCFQKEIADLVQTTGQNAWKNYLLGVQIQSFDDRILANAEAIKAETERAMQAENWLQENINKEVDRAMLAENLLQQNINTEVNRATAEEQRLDQKIDAETQRATTQEGILHQEIITETQRATQAENQIASDLAAEKLRAQTRENEIQAALDKEVRERIAADNDIINAIEQEVLARRAADTALQNTIDAVKNELTIDINNLTTQIAGITGGTTNLPYLKLSGGTMTGPVTFASEDTITVGRGPTDNLEVATKKYVDDAIAGGTTPGGDVTKEYVDQQIANVQAQVDGKLSKTGGTMSGMLDMDNNKVQNPVLNAPRAVQVTSGFDSPGMITNLGTPTQPSDAVSKQYLDEQLAGVGGDYLELSGGDMSGDINMTGNSVINFYDPDTQAAMAKPATTRSSTAIDLRPSKAARALGITNELLVLAQEQGVDVLNSDVGTVFNAVKATPAGQTLKGSVYNDNTDMCIKSETGKVGLKGTGVAISDGEGNNIPITGASFVGPTPTEGVTFKPTSTDITGPVNITNALGDPSGTVNTGKVTVGSTTLEPHTSSGVEHLDIDVASSAGAVFINRSQNGAILDGGTGELHLTEIHAPNELRLSPGSNINVLNHKITNITPGTGVNDAATVGQIPNTDNFLLKSGGTMTGPINMGGNVISGVGAPVNQNDVARLVDIGQELPSTRPSILIGAIVHPDVAVITSTYAHNASKQFNLSNYISVTISNLGNFDGVIVSVWIQDGYLYATSSGGTTISMQMIARTNRYVLTEGKFETSKTIYNITFSSNNEIVRLGSTYHNIYSTNNPTMGKLIVK